ncbi:uncharacterized protein LY79DRAFT_557444 [Colletotrichum navitas]|uniref:Uncharacterized protein n=1 Tax=Colletotrichum navitas TaxID=681940 RepID=A0AAD8PWA5_9PEZI|nr:uncharacterized protein LY79DRAFT_557444 [Colletotrichum navitas]KAK1585860.1 hypothetical protein LY79DRAFT_557444 [Colletotrichum navitas]
MKTYIIQFLTISTFAAVTMACDRYNYCRCTMADGSLNSTVTDDACKYLYTYSAKKHFDLSLYVTQNKDDATWCYQLVNDNPIYLGVDNCDMRVACTEVGATGSDSWCMDKLH